MSKSISIPDNKSAPSTVIEYPAGSFRVTMSWGGVEQNGYWRNSGGTQMEMVVWFNIPLTRVAVDKMWMEFDILDSGDIELSNGSVVSKQNPTMTKGVSTSWNGSAWQFRIVTRIDAGIRIKRIWFDVKTDEPPLGQSVIVPPPKILAGNGYKHHSKPGLPNPYIAGQVKHRGQPTQGTITMVTADNPEHIIATDANGRYFYQTLDNRMQLTANSNWVQHNDIVRREVYPNTNIAMPDFVGKFAYTRSSNGLHDILVGLIDKGDYWQFPETSDGASSTATVTDIETNELLCVDWTVVSEANFDKFKGDGWEVSGNESGTLALRINQSISYAKDGAGFAGFDNVRFTAFKIVKKSDSMATTPGYLNWDGNMASPSGFQEMTTDFVDVSGKTKLTCEIYPSNPTSKSIVWCFYDASKQLIGSRQVIESSDALSAFTNTIDVPASAKFIRIGARYMPEGYLKIT